MDIILRLLMFLIALSAKTTAVEATTDTYSQLLHPSHGNALFSYNIDDYYIEPTPTPEVVVVEEPTIAPEPEPVAFAAAATQVVATPEPVYQPQVQTTGFDLDSLLAQYDWPVWQAHAVAICESGGNPSAANYSAGAHLGLFQVTNGSFDPATNISQAYAKYRDGVSRGNPWYHWNQFGSCGHF